MSYTLNPFTGRLDYFQAASSSSSLTAETPSGTIDGSNVTFTVTNATLLLFLNGAFETAGGIDYTLSGTTITYVNPPPIGSTHTSFYGSAMNPQVPSGTIDGANVTFTVSGTITFLFLNGAFQTPAGVDYTLSGSTVTFVNPPPSGSGLYAI